MTHCRLWHSHIRSVPTGPSKYLCTKIERHSVEFYCLSHLAFPEQSLHVIRIYLQHLRTWLLCSSKGFYLEKNIFMVWVFSINSEILKFDDLLPSAGQQPCCSSISPSILEFPIKIRHKIFVNRHQGAFTNESRTFVKNKLNHKTLSE